MWQRLLYLVFGCLALAMLDHVFKQAKQHSAVSAKGAVTRADFSQFDKARGKTLFSTLESGFSGPFIDKDVSRKASESEVQQGVSLANSPNLTQATSHPMASVFADFAFDDEVLVAANSALARALPSDTSEQSLPHFLILGEELRQEGWLRSRPSGFGEDVRQSNKELTKNEVASTEQVPSPDLTAVRAGIEALTLFEQAMAAEPTKEPQSSRYRQWWMTAAMRSEERLRLILGFDRYNRLRPASR